MIYKNYLNISSLAKIFFIYILFSLFSLFSAGALNSTLAEDIQIYNNDHANSIVIFDNIGSSGNSSLQFGNSLTKSLSWDNTNNYFIFTDNVNFSNKQIKDVRLENNTLANKTCNNLYAGEVYFNQDDKVSYVCNGSTWKVLENSANSSVGLKPYFESLDKTSILKNETTDIILTGGNFTPQSIFSLSNSGAVLNYTVINSDTSVTLNVTGGSANAIVAIQCNNFFGNNLQFSVQN